MDTIEREVSTSAAEFRRGLELAFPGRVAAGAETLRVDDGLATMEISLVPGVPRTIAALRLPTLHVTIRFTQGTAAQRQAMLTYMDLSMQRGGG
jgi:hypothetical protein